MGHSATSACLQITKLGGVTDRQDGCVAIQQELDRLRKFANKNTTKFNKGKCKVLHMGRNNPPHRRQGSQDLIKVYEYLIWGRWRTKEDGPRLFTVVPSDRPRGNWHNLKYRKFHSFGILFKMSTVVKHWNRLSRRAVESVLGDAQNLTRHDSALADATVSRGLD